MCSASSLACNDSACLYLGDTKAEDKINLQSAQVTSMLLLEDILPEQETLLELQSSTSSTTLNSYQALNYNSLQFQVLNQVNQAMELLYLKGYINQQQVTTQKLTLSSKPKK